MKNIFLVITVLLFTIVSNAQELKVPQKAKDHFKDSYNPVGEYEVIWTSDNGMYIANFIRNDKKRHVYYAENGMFLLDKIEVPTERLKEPVQAYIQHNLQGVQIVAQYEVISNMAPEHDQLLIKESGKLYELTFTPEGEFHYKKEVQ